MKCLLEHRLTYIPLLLLLSLSGCVTSAAQREAARVRVLNPRPMIDIEARTEGLALVIAPEIPDQFDVPEQNGVTAVPVESWHASLTNGFKNGPGRFFASGDASPGLHLVLVDARLDYVPTAMLASRGHVLGAATVVARLRYVARLTNATGEVVSRAQGEVSSTQQWSEMGGSSTTGAEAIEAMYVDLTGKLLANPPDANRRTR